MTDTRDRLRARPPRLGQPRPPDRRGRGAAGRRRRRPRDRAGRRVDGHARGVRPARRRRGVRRARREARRRATSNGEIARAVVGHRRRRPGRARPTADRAGRHAEQVAARRQRDAGGVDGGRARRRRGAPASRCIAISAARTRRCCRCRRSRSSAAARMPDGASTSRTSWSSARRATSFAPGARLDGRGLPRRRRADEGARHAAGVADEGGWWPAFATNEQALADAGARRSSAPASRPASRSPSRSTSPRRSSAAAAATRSAWRTRARQRRPDRAADRLDRRYPIVSIEDPLAEDDAVGLRALHPRGRRPRAGRRRRFPGLATPRACARLRRAARPTRCC